MARRQIWGIIQSDPVSIAFLRRPKVKTADGGWAYGEEIVISPQTVTLIPMKRRMSQILVNTEMGDLPDYPYILIGRHDLVIERGDKFLHDGNRFEVISFDIKDEVRVAAQVDFEGGIRNG